MRRVLSSFVFLMACASAPGKPAVAAPEVQPFEQRAAESLSWQPGDSEPVARDLARWQALDTDRTIEPMRMSIDIRNRCAQTVAFAVGPASQSPPADAPRNELLAGAAIKTWLPSGDALHLQDSDGSLSVKATIASSTIVFLGDDACDRIAQE
jgi:hypothetical protein